MPIMPEGYYNRFNEAKNYDSHLFRAGTVLQSAELNEIQSAITHRVRQMGDVLFKDGAIIRDARLVVNKITGDTLGESGAIYLKGAVRGVPERSFAIPVSGIVTVGIYLLETVVTELEDPDLRDPAVGVRNYQEPGASRLQVIPQWGFVGQLNAPDAEFYPVYEVRDGVVVSKDPPPALDAVVTAITRYDQESSGGYYIVEGLRVSAEADQQTGEQVYSIQEGKARVNGSLVTLPTSTRLIYPAVADLALVDSEPHLSSTVEAQRVNLNHSPASSITQVRIIAEKTLSVTHGAYSGVLDYLPDTAIVALIAVFQGATTYTLGVDYQLTADQVDWSLAGEEPAPGSTYTVRYQYIDSVLPTAVDATGCTVTGAVSGSMIQITYQWKMPRWDRLCLDAASHWVWVKGVAHPVQPALPMIPAGLLLLASIGQTWTESRVVQNDSTRMVPMATLEAMGERIDDLYALTAQQRLLTNASINEPTSKLGVFVDPFLDDDLRDQGLLQTAAIVDGDLTLPVEATVFSFNINDTIQTLPINNIYFPVIEQTGQTGSMKINPYMAFDPLPSPVTLTPAQDFWSIIGVRQLPVITRIFGSGPRLVSRTSSTITITQSTTLLEMLRPITIRFLLTGFGPLEILEHVYFDGIEMTATYL